MISTQHIANDNEKIRTPRGFARARKSRIAPAQQPHPIRPDTLPKLAPTHIGPKKANTKSGTHAIDLLALAIWIACAIGLFFVQRDSLTPLPKIGLSILFGWASLFLLHVSKKRNRTYFKSLGIVSLIGSLALIALNLHIGFGIQHSTGIVLCSSIAVMLALSALLREKIPLVLSVILLAVWIGISHSTGYAGDLMWLLPTLFVAQYVVSAKLKSKLAITLLSITAFIWAGANLAGWVENAYLSINHALGLVLLGGMAYNRIGKYMQDSATPSGLLHTHLGWGIAAISALGLQYVLTAPVNGLSIDSRGTGGDFGLVGTLACVILAPAVMGISLMRTRSGYQSRVETAVLAILAICAAVVFSNPEFAVGVAGTISTSPPLFISLCIGGVIAASSTALMVNGARRGVAPMIFLGLAVLMAELYLVIPQLVAQPESLYAFGYSCLFSVLFLALFAQHHQTKPSARYHRYA